MLQRRPRGTIAMLVAACLLVCAAMNQHTHAQYLLLNSVMGSGNGDLANTQHHLSGTLGQPVVGSMTGGGNPVYTVSAGFWYAEQTVTDVASGRGLPTEFRLDQNYPNPFNPSTTVAFQLPQEGRVRLTVYDLLGREVEELASGQYAPGWYTARWDAISRASGIYYARLTVANDAGGVAYVRTVKLVLVK